MASKYYRLAEDGLHIVTARQQCRRESAIMSGAWKKLLPCWIKN